MAKKKKYYVVWKGRKTGIFQTWAECKAQIDGYPQARYKSYEQLAEAEAAFRQAPPRPAPKSATESKSTLKSTTKPIIPSIAVDAACSGNPGVMEYRGVITGNAQELFHQGPFPLGTQNIGEFLAIVHGLAHLQKLGNNLPIYSDSLTAMAWVRNKKIKTTLARNAKNESLFQLVDRALAWLENNTYKNPIYKWDTKGWGEIPADFGRK